MGARGHSNRCIELEAMLQQQGEGRQTDDRATEAKLNEYMRLYKDLQEEVRRQADDTAVELKLQEYVQLCQTLENDKQGLEDALRESRNSYLDLERQIQQIKDEAR